MRMRYGLESPHLLGEGFDASYGGITSIWRGNVPGIHGWLFLYVCHQRSCDYQDYAGVSQRFRPFNEKVVSMLVHSA